MVCAHLPTSSSSGDWYFKQGSRSRNLLLRLRYDILRRSNKGRDVRLVVKCLGVGGNYALLCGFNRLYCERVLGSTSLCARNESDTRQMVNLGRVEPVRPLDENRKCLAPWRRIRGGRFTDRPTGERPKSPRGGVCGEAATKDLRRIAQTIV